MARRHPLEQSRRTGFDTDEPEILRDTYERYLRGARSLVVRHRRFIDRAVERPWFDLALLWN